MMKPSFLRAQTERSRAQNGTTPLLRRLAVSTVDSVAREHYGAAYAIKCLQTSRAVQALLARLGIGARLWMGAFCAAEIFEEWGHDGWGGFWGDDHHIWLVTEFNELVDLNASVMHQHPRSRRKDGIPMPALWWDLSCAWPSVISYLPDALVGRIELPDPLDQANLQVFEASVMQRFEQTVATKRPDQLACPVLLEDIDQMQRLHEARQPWLNRAIAFQERRILLPSWMRERAEEIAVARRAGSLVPSRLSHRGDLVRQDST